MCEGQCEILNVSHLVGLDQPVRERDTMGQQLVDDAVVVLGVSGGVTVEVRGQQPPGLVCGAELEQNKTKKM